MPTSPEYHENALRSLLARYDQMKAAITQTGYDGEHRSWISGDEVEAIRWAFNHIETVHALLEQKINALDGRDALLDELHNDLTAIARRIGPSVDEP